MHHVFLISWIQLIALIRSSVTIATQSLNDSLETRYGSLNNSDVNVSVNVLSLEPFISVVSLPCPPHNHLELVCDASLGQHSCADRALIIDTCLHRFPGLYNNTRWDLCFKDVNRCDHVLEVLVREGLTEISAKPTSSSSTLVTSTSVSDSSYTSAISSITNIITPPTSNFSESSGSSTVTTETNTRCPSDTFYISTTMEDSVIEPSSEAQFPPPVSYVYPVIGALIIAAEILLLCILSCYKKKQRQNATAGSLVLQEEVIEPEVSSPTKAALHVNSLYDEDMVLKEDKSIFKSYINLKYIDDSSVESTPEKTLLRPQQKPV